MIAPIATAEDHQRAMADLLQCVRQFTECWGVAPDHLLLGRKPWVLLSPMFQPIQIPAFALADPPKPAGTAAPSVQVFGVPVLPTHLDPDLIWAESDRLVVLGDRIRAIKFSGTTRQGPRGQVSTYAVQASLDQCNWRQMTANGMGHFHIDLPGDRDTVVGYWNSGQRGIVFDPLPPFEAQP